MLFCEKKEKNAKKKEKPAKKAGFSKGKTRQKGGFFYRDD